MKNSINKFFNETALECHLNLGHRLSWGFYFSHNDSGILKKAKSMLDSEGFSKLEICYENKTYYLCVEEINIHTCETLCERCIEFDTLAQKLNIHSFDGFDVEEIGLR